jgi:hypothetical protein
MGPASHCWARLEHSIKAAMSAGVVKRQSLATVIVDTTVQPKAIAHPTDSRLLTPAYLAVGITNSAPLAMLLDQRCMMLFCLV